MILDHSVRSEIIIRIVACDNYDGFSTTQLHSFMKVNYTIFKDDFNEKKTRH
jgi:hypothetical protein